MGYLLLAVVFYTVVKYSVKMWLQFRYEKDDAERDHGYGREIMELQKRVETLEGPDVPDEK